MKDAIGTITPFLHKLSTDKKFITVMALPFGADVVLFGEKIASSVGDIYYLIMVWDTDGSLKTE